MSARHQNAVPILARIWHEDDVWNVSAFDLPIVAYSKGIDDARANFEEAIQSHFEALASLNRLDTVAKSLVEIAEGLDFYEDRVKPHVLVESFVFHLLQEQAA